jgi:DNA adenine methylase
MGTRLVKPFRYHGGKEYLARRIVAMMPAHDRYLEAYAGGLSVLLCKDGEGVAEWVNDTNWRLMNFWRVLQSQEAFEIFRRFVEAIPLSQAEWEDVDAIWKQSHTFFAPRDPEEAAACATAFFVLMRQSRQGLGKDYCTPTSRTRRGMNEQVSAWLSAVDGLPEVHARLRRVEVWCRPAVEAIKKLDSSTTLVYADPPYLHTTRSTTSEYGDHEMTAAQHVELLDTLAGMKGKFLLSGYRSELYDGYELSEGWTRTEFELPNNASSSKSKERKVECVWTNFEPEVVKS